MHCPYCKGVLNGRCYELITKNGTDYLIFDSLYCLNNYVWDNKISDISNRYKVVATK